MYALCIRVCACICTCVYIHAVIHVYTEDATYVMHIGITQDCQVRDLANNFWSKIDVVKVVTMQLQTPWSELPNLAILTMDSKYLSGELRLRQNVEEVQNHAGIELSHCKITLR